VAIGPTSSTSKDIVASDAFGLGGESVGPKSDVRQADAAVELLAFFNGNRDKVFFSRQIEVLYEDTWFHWITNRALRDLVARDLIQSETRHIGGNRELHLMWHRSNRYYRREAARLVHLVEEYSDPNIGAALGLQGEALVLEGFARRQFVMMGRNTQEFHSVRWIRTEHNLDFVFEKEGIAYGVEVKNTLGYMPLDELEIKIEMCAELGLRPVFAARMLPKSWVKDVVDGGGFALIMKYQLYPWTHREPAKRVREDLGLPVDAPRALQEGTMDRFVRWHEQNL
jgi:hypothetical protein